MDERMREVMKQEKPETGSPEENMLPEERKEAPVRESFWKDNRGVGVVEMILILVVLIALVLIFKTQLNSLVNTIFKTITKNAKSVLK